MSFTENEGATANLLTAYSSCDPGVGLPTNLWPICTTYCTDQWYQPAGTLACSNYLAPPVLRTCQSGSPLASTFVNLKGSNIVPVDDGIALNAALAGVSKPTIIQLRRNGTYTLERVYYLNYDVCIQVGIYISIRVIV